NLVEPVGDHGCDVVVIAHAHHRDQVDLAGHRVDLGDAVDRGDALGDLRDPVDRGLDEHDGGDHGDTLVRHERGRLNDGGVPGELTSRALDRTGPLAVDVDQPHAGRLE